MYTARNIAFLGQQFRRYLSSYPRMQLIQALESRIAWSWYYLRSTRS